MRRTLTERRQEFRQFWKHYVFQCVLGMFGLCMVMLVLSAQNIVVVASIGSTIFIIFALPTSINAQPRNVIGGHMIGFLSGSLCHIIPHQSHVMVIVVYCLAVGISMFVMIITDMEHPPASSTALGVAMTGFLWHAGIALLVSTIILSVIHVAAQKYIKDLLLFFFLDIL